jgi:hypothetical protein
MQYWLLLRTGNQPGSHRLPEKKSPLCIRGVNLLPKVTDHMSTGGGAGA